MQKLVVQQSWINDSEFIGYYVAEAAGDYRNAGLEVVMRPGSAAVTPERTLLDGTSDIALCAPESVAATVRATGHQLHIVAAQFQKSPLGIVSRADDPVTNLRDLAGRALAVPDMNRPMVEELLRHARLAPADVSLVPYTHDPAPLLERRIAGLVDFIVDPQYRMAEAGVPAHAILLADHGAPLPNNVAVVTRKTLETRRGALAAWVAASRRGWERNYADPARYPAELRGAPLVETRTLAHETFANRAFRPLVETPHGIMSLTPDLIEATLAYLERTGNPLDHITFAPLG